MEKIKSLNWYQKGILIFMLAMSLIFAVIYPKTIARVGYRYNDAILVPTQENGDTVYSGKIKGEQAEFLVFRGGVLDFGDSYYLYNEDGTLDNFGFSYVSSDGIERDENGNVIDRMEPSASTIYELLNEPELTHKGEAYVWCGATFICILNALTIFFADELFCWDLAFRIRNVDNAEPSEWEIAGRYIGWTVMTIMALVIFIVGLR